MGSTVLGDFPAAYPIVVADFTPAPDLVDSVEAAEILGVTLNHMRQLVFKKRLTPVGRKGRRSMFRRPDVLALHATRTKEDS